MRSLWVFIIIIIADASSGKQPVRGSSKTTINRVDPKSGLNLAGSRKSSEPGGKVTMPKPANLPSRKSESGPSPSSSSNLPGGWAAPKPQVFQNKPQGWKIMQSQSTQYTQRNRPIKAFNPPARAKTSANAPLSADQPSSSSTMTLEDIQQEILNVASGMNDKIPSPPGSPEKSPTLEEAQRETLNVASQTSERISKPPGSPKVAYDFPSDLSNHVLSPNPGSDVLPSTRLLSTGLEEGMRANQEEYMRAPWDVHNSDWTDRKVEDMRNPWDVFEERIASIRFHETSIFSLFSRWCFIILLSTFACLYSQWKASFSKDVYIEFDHLQHHF